MLKTFMHRLDSKIAQNSLIIKFSPAESTTTEFLNAGYETSLASTLGTCDNRGCARLASFKSCYLGNDLDNARLKTLLTTLCP